MKNTLTRVVILLLVPFILFSQPNYTALTQVTPFTGKFRAGINMGYHPNWTNGQLAVIAAGSPSDGQLGVGAKTTRPGLYEDVFAIYGYNLNQYDFQVYANLGMDDFTGIVGGVPQWNQDFTNYCPGQPSTIYKNLYLPIWDTNNGTPYNENNPYASYIYKLVENYRDHVTFWEIWNEPGFDFSQQNGRKQPGEPGNWWDNDPAPCDYQLRAPIQHYVRMLRISWEIIKTLDPTSYVTLGDPGFPSFLDAVCRNTDKPTADTLGAAGSITTEFPLKGGAYFDCVSFHAYPHFDYTAFDPVNNIYQRHSDGAANGLVTAQNRFKTVLSTHGFNGSTYPKKEWIVTEYNAPRRAITGDWLSGSEMQKNYILKVLMKAKIENIAQMHVYELFDHTPETEADEEFDLMGMYANQIGVLPYNQVVQPQGKAMKTFTDLLFDTDYDAAQTAALDLPAGVKGYAFQEADGGYIYALWAETLTDQSEAATQTYSFPAALGLNSLVRYDWDYGYSRSSANATATSVALTATPAFFKENDPSSCALSATVTNIQCNNNLTAADPSDDKFSFQITVNGSGTTQNTWIATLGGQTVMGNYGTPKTLSGYSIAAGNLNFTVSDSSNAACITTVNVTAPPTCSNQSANQYCTSKGDFPWHEWISGVKTGILNNNSSKSNYSDFTNTSANLTAGGASPISIKAGFSWLTFDEYVRVWIDYNRDKVFDADEVAYEGILAAPTLGTTEGVLNGILQIPSTANAGTTRMRVSMKRGAYPQPCDLIPFGEVEDYTVNISAMTNGCNISANISNKICNNNGTPTIGGDDTFTFEVLASGSNTGTGWSVQVGSTVFGGLYDVPKTLGPFSILTGTQDLTFYDNLDGDCSTLQSVQPPGACSNGGGTGTYCTSKGDFPWHDWIAQIKLGDLNYTSSKSSYSDFLTQIATVSVGATYPMQLTTGFSWFGYDEYWRVWIDFNKNGLFEANEMVVDKPNAAPQYPSTLWSTTANVSIPAGAAAGVTRMRVVMRRGNTAPEPCGNYEFGETEDYSVNITNGGQTCQVFAQISNLSCQNNGTANNPSDDTYSYTLTVSGAGVGTGWQANINGTAVTGTYGTPKNLSGYLISEGIQNFIVEDDETADCSQVVSVVPPDACSNATGPCTSKSDFPWHDWIAKVQFSNLNNVSGKSQFSDFTSQTVNVAGGGTYPLSIAAGFSFFSFHEYWRIWIDLDKDGQFEVNEVVFEDNFPAGAHGIPAVNFSGNLVIPSNAPAGLTKMRVSMKRDAYPAPCETLPFGEVEDYSVNIANGLQAGTVRETESTEADFSDPSKIVVFPNPAGEYVRIFVEPYDGKELKISLLNQLGYTEKCIFYDKIEVPFVEIPLNDIKNGQYFLQFISSESRPVNKKLVVARMY